MRASGGSHAKSWEGSSAAWRNPLAVKRWSVQRQGVLFLSFHPRLTRLCHWLYVALLGFGLVVSAWHLATRGLISEVGFQGAMGTLVAPIHAVRATAP